MYQVDHVMRCTSYLDLVKIDVTTPTFTAGFMKRLPPGPMAIRSYDYTHKAMRLCGYSNEHWHPYGDAPK